MPRFKYLMIHHSDGPPDQTVEAIRRYHVQTRGWRDVGYHYLLQRDGEGRGHLKRGRSDAYAGAHCDGPGGWNSKALGVCVIGTFHPGLPHSEKMTEELYQDVLGAVLHLMGKYSIPATHLTCHREHDTTSCPGDWFPMARLKADVRRLLG
jgi:N-acetylmuramoyl-L-alanine amidase